MLDLVKNGEKSAEDIEFFNLQPQENHSGIENIRCLEINGKKVFLEQNELNYKSKCTSDGVTIPCWNEKVMALADAFMLGKGKYKLALIASCPRVNAAGNIREQATGVQELYKRRGKSSVVITISWRGIAVRFPEKEWEIHSPEIESEDDSPEMEWELEKWKNASIGELLIH